MTSQYFWSAVEKKLCEDERSWPDGRSETRDGFVTWLRRVAKNWPQDEINRATGDLARQTELLLRAKGKLFDENAVL